MIKTPTLRRIFSGVQIVLLIVVLVVTLVSELTQYKQYEYMYDKYGTSSIKITNAEAYEPMDPVSEGSLGFKELYSSQPVYGIIALALIGFCIIIFAASIIRKSFDRDGLLHILLPMITTVAYFLFFLMGGLSAEALDDKYFTVYNSNKNILMTVFFILISVVIISFVKRSKLLNPPKEAVKVEVTTNTVPASTDADELAKYKALLDSGAITEEEYNEKKKQLLGL